ncbi:hypothetical protein [Bosea sp. PAMC 26642]|uniref:hypothetical protein n=1 Tax=Bosea sp. (strain PAMC 26642) TaxID=1792307 RepID=UPI000770519E|nr:hypothetical protein [Bosea sp. PAMC 26642]AMJ60952.1 hypothetical protein AXW83_12180 [Bosea sp. PAMC 26642]
MSDQSDPNAPLPDVSPEDAATELVDEYQEAAIDYCADGVREAKAADNDVAMYHWLRVTREVVRRLIAQREELGG